MIYFTHLFPRNPILNLQHSHKIGEKSEEMGKGKGGVSALATYCHQKFWGGRKVFFAGIGKELCLYFIMFVYFLLKFFKVFFLTFKIEKQKKGSLFFENYQLPFLLLFFQFNLV